MVLVFAGGDVKKKKVLSDPVVNIIGMIVMTAISFFSVYVAKKASMNPEGAILYYIFTSAFHAVPFWLYFDQRLQYYDKGLSVQQFYNVFSFLVLFLIALNTLRVIVIIFKINLGFWGIGVLALSYVLLFINWYEVESIFTVESFEKLRKVAIMSVVLIFVFSLISWSLGKYFDYLRGEKNFSSWVVSSNNE
jgi:hypothetical protein